MKRSFPELFVPSIADVIALSVFFVGLYAGVSFLQDGDTGWHLVTGRGIMESLSVPYSDPYSHTMPGTPWTAHEWLSEAIFAAIENAGGLNAVVVFTSAVIALTFLFVYKYMLKRGVSPLIAALWTVTAASTSMLHWLARPHILSFPMTFAFLVALDLYRREGKNYLKFLPLLMAVWVNLHGGYILGLILIFIYAGADLLSGRRDRFKTLAVIALATIIATFINPQGPKILYFPFHLVGRKFIMDNVLEWQSPNFHDDRAFEVMLIMAVAVLVLSRRKPGLAEAGTGLLLVHMSLYSARYIPLFALLVAPMAAVRTGEALDAVLGGTRLGIVERLSARFRKMSERITPLELRFNKSLWVYAVIAACFLLAVNGGGFWGAKFLDYDFSRERFPVDALEFAANNKIGGRMFNNDGWGGYIIYKESPRYKVFFDGRSDMYGVDFGKEYLKVARARLGSDEILDKYKVDWVIYNANAPLCQYLRATGGWKLVYADNVANVLLRDTPGNRALIEKYKYARFVPVKEDKD